MLGLVLELVEEGHGKILCRNIGGSMYNNSSKIIEIPEEEHEG